MSTTHDTQAAGANRRLSVIGVDVCGECPVLLDIAEEQVEAATNDTVNERLLRLLSDDSVS